MDRYWQINQRHISDNMISMAPSFLNCIYICMVFFFLFTSVGRHELLIYYDQRISALTLTNERWCAHLSSVTEKCSAERSDSCFAFFFFCLALLSAVSILQHTLIWRDKGSSGILTHAVIKGVKRTPPPPPPKIMVPRHTWEYDLPKKVKL